MQVSTETINGELMTVIRKPFDAEWVNQQLSIGVPVTCEFPKTEGTCYQDGRVIIVSCDGSDEYKYITWQTDWDTDDAYCTDRMLESYIITTLPPLPRNPTADDAWLLHLYASHGLYAAFGIYQFAHIDDDGEVYVYGNAGLEMISSPETTHCVYKQGNRVDVAIKEV